jgi:hypothetical protein
MTGWIVANTSSSGVRAIRVRSRRATTKASTTTAEVGILTRSTAAVIRGLLDMTLTIGWALDGAFGALCWKPV